MPTNADPLPKLREAAELQAKADRLFEEAYSEGKRSRPTPAQAESVSLAMDAADNAACSLPLADIAAEVERLRNEVCELKAQLNIRPHSVAHVCGLTGFGNLDDVCPACEVEAKERNMR